MGRRRFYYAKVQTSEKDRDHPSSRFWEEVSIFAFACFQGLSGFQVESTLKIFLFTNVFRLEMYYMLL